MMLPIHSRLLLTATLLTLGTTAAPAQSPADKTPAWFQPYEFLIGEWESKVDGQVGAVMTFEWGPRRAYIKWTAIRILGERRVHAFEGILANNGVSGRVEFLMPLGPGDVMEKGDFEVFPDGRLRRNIEVFYPGGTRLPPTGEQTAPDGGLVRRYEQMFLPVDPNTVRSTVFYLEDGRWLPSFPGADRIVMERVL